MASSNLQNVRQIIAGILSVSIKLVRPDARLQEDLDMCSEDLYVLMEVISQYFSKEIETCVQGLTVRQLASAIESSLS